ncbi:MAG: hypothetical protein IJD42_07450 [Clostridia bacterium]|nr:hypothetical protein [Clostridia bacterium]
MKEIGGYFGLEEFEGEEYHKDAVAVNNARNALLYILEAKHVGKIYIPYFLCDSVSDMCKREGYEFGYYHIDENFMPIFEDSLEENEYLYVVNYYGQIGKDRIAELKRRYKSIIVDNVQAFFEMPIAGIDTVYSCRKFFGVPDGGYVYCTTFLKNALSQDASKDRMTHVLGRYEGENASDYYAAFKSNDRSFKDLPLMEMSKLTHNLLKAADYDSICQKREENFEYLHKALGDKNKLKLKTPIGPYAYPFYCKNGMEIKKKLAEKKIYVPTLWPNVLTMHGSLEKDYAENILPLPCDQRYGIEDMQRMVEDLLKCLD